MDLIDPLQTPLLPSDAPISDQWSALRKNIQAWYRHQAFTANTPTFLKDDCLCTTEHCTLRSESSVEDDAVLDSALGWYRQNGKEPGAILWFLSPDPPVRLGARLFARGVSPNWEPTWMWYSLNERIQIEQRNEKFEIRFEQQDTGASNLEAPVIWKISAFKEEECLGSCCLNITTGPHGIGAIFDMFVDPSSRKQGIGTALAQSSCDLASKLGCHHIVLDATDAGVPMYRRVGFQLLQTTPTWFLKQIDLKKPPPGMEQVRFLEAVGMGNKNALAQLKDLPLAQLSEETVNGMTPLEIAVHCKQPASAEWLLGQGVIPDIMSLWDLSWRDRIPDLLATHPEAVKRKSGPWTATPLHIAIERDDLEMVKILLSVPNDMECKDGVFGSTALGWANHFQRPEILKVLEEYQKH